MLETKPGNGFPLNHPRFYLYIVGIVALTGSVQFGSSHSKTGWLVWGVCFYFYIVDSDLPGKDGIPFPAYSCSSSVALGVLEC